MTPAHKPPLDAVASEPLAEKISVLRAAAKAMRHDVEGHPFPERQLPATILATADWLDGEAATQASFEGFADILNLAVSRKGGPESYIRFGRTEDGEIAMVCDTMDAALAVALAYLDGRPSPLTAPQPPGDVS